MPNPRGNRRAPKRGQNAMKSIAKNSKDQAPINQRTNKKVPNHLLNGYGIDIKAMKRDLMMVKSLLNTEEKHVDTLGTSSVTSASPVIIGMGTVAQGSAVNQRTGDSTKLIRHDLNLVFNYNTGTVATTAQETQVFNWYYIKYNKTPSSSGTSAFGISEFLNVDTNGNFTPLSLPNTDTNENFTILDSGQVRVGPQIIGTAAINSLQFVESSISRPFHQTYNGSGTSNICDNMVFLVVTAFNGINAGGASSVSYGVRQWYLDN